MSPRSGRVVSPDVAMRAAETFRLTEVVGHLTDTLERESDNALMALTRWGNAPAHLI